MTQMNLYMKEKQTHRHREQTCGCQGPGEVWIEKLVLGSPVRGILQARTLEWVAVSFSNA